MIFDIVDDQFLLVFKLATAKVAEEFVTNAGKDGPVFKLVLFTIGTVISSRLSHLREFVALLALESTANECIIELVRCSLCCSLMLWNGQYLYKIVVIAVLRCQVHGCWSNTRVSTITI